MPANLSTITAASQLDAARNKEIARLNAELAGVKTALAAQAKRRRSVSVRIAQPNNSIRFAVIGDTQFGSLYEAKDQCAALYERFAAEGIRDVLHAGDVLEGHGIYKGQEFEVHKHGWQAQREWFAEVAPRVPGITTHFITGNHDASFRKSVGLDVGASLQAVRPDWRFVGADTGRVTLAARNGQKFNVMLLHPSGGTAYAVSYHIQKIVEQLAGGSKPDMICVGHYHKAELLPSYRNVACIQSGCLQFQTPFMSTKGLAAHVGGWIVRIVPGKAGDLHERIQTEFIAFY